MLGRNIFFEEWRRIGSVEVRELAAAFLMRKDDVRRQYVDEGRCLVGGSRVFDDGYRTDRLGDVMRGSLFDGVRHDLGGGMRRSLDGAARYGIQFGAQLRDAISLGGLSGLDPLRQLPKLILDGV